MAAQEVCSDLSGVWIYCNWKLIQGNRAHKARAQHPDAFIPVGGMPLYFAPVWARYGEIAEQSHPRGRISDLIKNTADGPPESSNVRKGRNILWIFCSTGSVPLLPGDGKILTLLGFGAGDVPTSLLAGISAYAEEARETPGDSLQPGREQREGHRRLS